jgi:membrane protein DedA with SNARE-associated domain
VGLLIAGGVVALGLLLALWEGELPELTANPTRALASLLPALHRLPPYPLLLIEESGIPLPLPGDVVVMFVGTQVRGHPIWNWIMAWAALVVCITIGATNLFLIARRLGRDFPNSRLGRLMHVTPERMQKANRWFERWGPWVVVFGRHIPGFRIALTVAAAVGGLSLRMFVLSVVLSSTVWVAFFMILGAQLGGAVDQLLNAHRPHHFLLPLVLAPASAAYAWYRRR